MTSPRDNDTIDVQQQKSKYQKTSLVLLLLGCIEILPSLLLDNLCDWLEFNLFFSLHDSIIFFQDKFLDGFATQIRVMVLFLCKFLLDVTHDEKLGDYWMKQILFSAIRSNFVVTCEAIFIMTKKKFTQSFQLRAIQAIQLEILYFQRLLLEKLNSFGLGFDALKLIVVVNGVDTKPAWDGGGIDVDVVDEKRAAEGQYLNDDEGFYALKFLPHSFFEGEFIMGQDAISLLFLLFQGDIRGVILFEGLPSLLVDQLCLLGIHLQFL